jgi:hypothetical protein
VLINWIKSLYKDRKFYCKNKISVSSTKTITRGIPQGAILSGFMMNLLMAGLPSHETIKLTNYADDILPFTIGLGKIRMEQEMQLYLHRIYQYLASLKLPVNPKKCAVLAFDEQGEAMDLNLSIGGKQIVNVQSLKYLE